jgi:DNA-binding NarL/FixJ family response regulator
MSSRAVSHPHEPPPGLVVYRVDVGDDKIALLTYPIQVGDRTPALTEAERGVLRAILDGKTNAQIAAHRRTASRTVANQIAQLFRKMGVRSRAELAARYLTGRP